MTPQQTVDAFIGALEQMDIDTALTYVADDIEYDNVPMGKVVGVDAVRSTLTPFLGRSTQVEWRVLHQAATGDVVMNERLDRFHMPNGWIEIAVAGLFVVRDGKITLWRDYFDLGAATTAMASGG
jgi:limonene-1,2-epoxide hydrolase